MTLPIPVARPAKTVSPNANHTSFMAHAPIWVLQLIVYIIDEGKWIYY
jgi:hypothetical protein